MHNIFNIHKKTNCLSDNWLLNSSGDGRIRTADTRIFSPMLYRLSYITLKRGTKIDSFIFLANISTYFFLNI